MSDALLRPIVFDRLAYEQLVADCSARYPLEACGILVGRDETGARRVLSVRQAKNIWPDDGERTHRYLIDPHAQMTAERDAETAGQLVIGFYHSHPDADPVPSRTDAAAAWPFYTYTIVRTGAGGQCVARCWQLLESDNKFAEAQVAIL